MDRPKRTWLTVLLAVVIVAAVLGLSALGGLIYFFYSRVHTETVTEATAAERLEQHRQRFAGREPLVEIRSGNEVVVHRRPAAAGGEPSRLQTLRLFVYDASDGQLVDASLPFWLLRLAPDGNVSMATESGGRVELSTADGGEVDLDRLGLTVKDLEAHGPGLIVDHRDPRGGHILIWTE
jgi:hypothetical protein